jgi:drug/metabolite transporter (DMT)-like permease
MSRSSLVVVLWVWAAAWLMCAAEVSGLKLDLTARKLAKGPRRNFDAVEVASAEKLVGTWKEFPGFPPVAPSPSKQDAKATARLVMLATSALYGTNYGCVKLLGEALDPSVASALRFLIASSLFLPYLWKAAKGNPLLILGACEIGLYDAVGFFAQAKALETAPASTVAFICALQVVVVPLLSMGMMGMKRGNMGVRKLGDAWAPAILAVMGVACLELGGSEPPGQGDLWALLQPLLFGFSYLRLERHMALCTAPGEAAGFTAAALGVVTLFSLAWCGHDFVLPLLQQGGGALQVGLVQQFHALADWRVPAALLWTGVMTTAVTAYGENIAMKSLDAAESTVIFSTEPLWGTAFAAAVLGETVGWNTAIGAVLIVAACAYRYTSRKVVATVAAAQLTTSGVGVEVVAENVLSNASKLLEELVAISAVTSVTP